jgi:hypothetical protein
VPALLSGSGRDNSQSTTSPGTLTAPEAANPSREFVPSTCSYSVAAAHAARIIPRIFRIMVSRAAAAEALVEASRMTASPYTSLDPDRRSHASSASAS